MDIHKALIEQLEINKKIAKPETSEPQRAKPKPKKTAQAK